MTPKQMYRAMRKWKISLIYYNNYWFAGDCEQLSAGGVAMCNFCHSGSLHSGGLPESAVEDYCNARNLEWDV